MFPLHPHDPPRIGPFTLLGRLGEEACTRVYLASARKHGEVALKVVRSTYTAEPAFRTAFARRVESARELRSPYVATVLDTNLEHATPWVAVERPPGPTLTRLVNAHGPLPAGALHPLALALAQGLADLHATHRTHASLSPDAVLLTEHGAALTDAGFEWAMTEVDDKAPHPGFAAPEGGAGPAIDVYAWAAVLCWAAGGGDGGLDQLPLQLRGLVEACLQEASSLRPTALDLVRMLGGPTTPDPWPPDVAAVIDRSRKSILSAVAAARPKGRKAATGKGLVFTAAGMSLVLVAGLSVVWALRNDSSESTEAAEDNTPELITDAGCLDDPGFPPPSDEIDDLDAMQVAFSPDGDLLAVTSYNHGLTLWDWREGEEIARPVDEKELFALGDPVFAPVGCMVAVRTTSDQHENSSIGFYTTLDIPSGELHEHLGPQSERALDGLVDPRAVQAVDFSPTGSTMLIHVETDRSLENRLPSLGVVDMNTGELTTSWGGEVDDLIHRALFIDENRVATLGSLTVALRDLQTGETEHTLRNVTEYSLDVGADGKHVAFFDEDHLVVWNLEAQEAHVRFPVPEYHAEEDSHPTDLTLDTESGFLHFSWAVSERGSTPEGTDRNHQNHGHLWDLETGQDFVEENDELTPRPVAFHPREEAIASIDHDGDVRLLDPETFDVIRTIP